MPKPDRTARHELPPASYSAPDRDPIITIDGCRIYLHIHDAEYMRQRAQWKTRLAAAHPDHGGDAATFRKLIGQRFAWQQREAIWYAQLGLLPPDSWGEHTIGAHQRTRQRALAVAARDTSTPRTTSDRRLQSPARHSNKPQQRSK